MGTFGVVGYYAYQWDQRAAVLLAEKRAEIAERRQQQLSKAEELSGNAMAEAGGS